MRCVDGRVGGQGMREDKRNTKKSNNILPLPKALPPSAHLLPSAAQRSAVSMRDTVTFESQTLMLTLHDLFGCSTVALKEEAE